LSLLRRPHGRHHQVARREGRAEGSRERDRRHSWREGGRGRRRPGPAPRSSREGVRRPREGRDAHGEGDRARGQIAARGLHGAQARRGSRRASEDRDGKDQENRIGVKMESKQKIRSFIVENFYVPETANLGDDTPLIESGIVDSTGVLEVVAFLEETFSIAI